jgi:hypothetical protein
VSKKQKELLIDNVASVRLELAETNKDGKTIVRGEFARAGEATENKRMYPSKVWEGQIKRLKSAMTERQVFGEIDHPSDGRTSLQRVSHIVTDMRVENGVLIGEAEILPTEKGKILETLLKSNCKIGVSSRGFGSVKANDSGVDVVQEDYRLVTFDFVAEPADKTAYPEVFFEGVEFPEMSKPHMTGEDPRKDSDIRIHAKEDEKKAKEWAAKLLAKDTDPEPVAVPEPVAAPAATVGEAELPATLLTKLAEMRAEIRDEIRGELLSDPEVAGSVRVVESLKELLRPFLLPEDAEAVVSQKDEEIRTLNKKIAEQTLRLKELEEDNDKLGNVAKEAGYKFYLERVLSEDPQAELIRNLIGDVTQFGSSDELKARVEAVRVELSKQREEDAALEAQVAEQVGRANELARSVQEKADEREGKLREAVEKLMESNKQLAVELHTERKLRNHPRSKKIRSMVERSSRSKQDVDDLIEDLSAPAPHDEEEAQSWRSRVRKHNGSRTRENDVLEEEVSRSPEKSPELFGVPMNDLKTLSGIR